jgi:hypothetical protein
MNGKWSQARINTWNRYIKNEKDLLDLWEKNLIEQEKSVINTKLSIERKKKEIENMKQELAEQSFSL